MSNQEIFFVICSFLAVIFALSVYVNKNPVYSVICLILTFIFSSCTLITIGEDFLGIILVIIYVGAITVLLLFIIMTLNIKKFIFLNKQNKLFNFTKILFFISVWLSIFKSLYTSIYTAGTTERIRLLNRMDIKIDEYPIKPGTLDNPEFPFVVIRNVNDSVMPIGQYLYNEFIIFFLLAALILLIAMIGSILIAQQEKTLFKKQNSFEQINKKFNQCITIIPKK